MDPAIFLDRDGVIIENRTNYIRSGDDVLIFPQALAALARVRQSPYRIVIVTNQSAVGRGLMALNQAEEINRKLVEAIEAAGGRVDGVFMCPHAPQDGCACRKPKPGLLHEASQALSIDLSRSIMIGDAISDLEAGQAAGVGQLALVRTGRGAEQALLAKSAQIGRFNIYPNLEMALADLVP